jgi:uncharacterized membrane protein
MGAEMRKDVSAVDAQNAAIDRRQLAANRISEMCKYIGFGLLALAVATNSPISRSSEHTLIANLFAFAISLAGLLTIALEYANTLCIYLAADAATKDDAHKHLYNQESLSMRLSKVFFVGKQISAIFGCTAVLYVFSIAALNASSSCS